VEKDMQRLIWTSALAAALAAGAAVSAQQQEVEQPGRIPGWSFTPSVTIGTLFDSNISLTSPPFAGTTEGDTLFAVQPGGELGFFSRRTEFSAAYQGYLRRYVDVDALNGFDQRATLSLRRAATKRVSLFVNNFYADMPTTDETELNGVPFRRAGSRTNRLAAGLDARLTKFTTLSTRYDMTWATFDQTDEFLNNGTVHSAQAKLGRQLSERLAVAGDYAFRFATLDDDTRRLTFHDTGGTATWVAAPRTRLFGSAGMSTMFDELPQERRTGPYYRLGVDHTAEYVSVGASFGRQFLPSFGFGGSNETQELSGFVRAPLGRRLYTSGSVTWRHAIPLLESSIEADTYFLRGSVGYLAARWARVEGFYAFTRYDPIDLGGDVSRHRVGVQIVLLQPVRIR
jgi:hypothetical protein